MAILEMFKKEDGKKPKKDEVVKSTAKDNKPAVKVKKEKIVKDQIKSDKNINKSSTDKDKMFIKLVTEKTTDLALNGAYSFKIGSNLNKIIVKNEIKKLYGISPIKINIINSPYKKISYRGRASKRPGFKKAIVYLNKGDKLPE